jgi:hypothetical protein
MFLQWKKKEQQLPRYLVRSQNVVFEPFLLFNNAGISV